MFWLFSVASAGVLLAAWTESRSMKAWPGVPAQVTAATCVRLRVGPRYQPHTEVAYLYHVRGNVYRARDVFPGCETGDLASRSSLIAGEHIQVFYNPARPAQSVLSTSRSLKVEIMTFILLCSVAIFMSHIARLSTRGLLN
jgi:hypothetical protein